MMFYPPYHVVAQGLYIDWNSPPGNANIFVSKPEFPCPSPDIFKHTMMQFPSKLPRSKLRGIHRRTIVMGAAAPNPLLAHSSRQQADGYSGITNK